MIGLRRSLDCNCDLARFQRRPEGIMGERLAYRFVIIAEAGNPAEVLELLSDSAEAALAAARIFAESAAYVELWQGERRIWPALN